MTQFLAVSNRKGGVGKSTIAVMLAHAAASWSKRRVLVMDLDRPYRGLIRVSEQALVDVAKSLGP